MKKIEVLYSSVFESNVFFIEKLYKWLKNYNIEISIIPYNDFSIAQAKLYRNNDIIINNRMVESCLVDIFYEGKIIDSVPFERNKIYSALNIEYTGIDNEINKYTEYNKNILTENELRNNIINNNIEWIPIMKDTIDEEMTINVFQHEYDDGCKKIKDKCYERKKKIFDEIWEKEECAGIYAKYNDNVIGILEVIPREIIKKYGSMTGVIGDNSEYLTCGCYEVVNGIPRIVLIDELMRQLENIYDMFSRKYIEGIGTYGNINYTIPYWVFDKYGFKRVEVIDEKKIVMQKHIK